MPTRRRTIIQVTSASTAGDPHAPSTLTPKTTTVLRADWTMAGDTTDVRGFNIVLTPTNGNPRNTTDIIKSRQLNDPALRSYTFTDLQAGTYVAWVQAFVDGADSDWVSSTGITVSDDQVPTFRSSDDRNSAAYVEDFRSASIPPGVTVSLANYDLATTRGELAMQQQNTAFAMSVSWALPTWAAGQSPAVEDFWNSAQLANSGAKIIVKMMVDNPASYSASNPVTVDFQGGVTGFERLQLPIVNDGKYHLYYLPVGKVAFTSFNPLVTINIPVSVGALARVDAIALAWGNFDSSLDGNVDHGITSRRQFGKDNGGGYFLTSSIRQPGDATGSQLIIDPNGIFYFRNADGGVSETGYKLGRRCDLGPVSNLGSNIWGQGSMGFTAIALRPVLPQPKAMNKIRLVIEPKGGVINDSPPQQPVRQYIDVYDLGIEGWSFTANFFYGGTPNTYIATGPWSQSAEAKSALTLDANHNFNTTNNNDGWYYATDDLPIQNDNAIYYRSVVWIKVVMPSRAKSDGRPYSCDLSFQVHRGYALMNSGASRMDMSEGYAGRTYVARAYTDGQTRYFPIWFGNPAQFAGNGTGFAREMTKYDMQSLKVDWWSQLLESGAPTGSDPLSVEIDHIEWDYIGPNGAQNPTKSSIAGESFILTYLEEFA